MLYYTILCSYSISLIVAPPCLGFCSGVLWGVLRPGVELHFGTWWLFFSKGVRSAPDKLA